jgi:hypothetical protein
MTDQLDQETKKQIEKARKAAARACQIYSAKTTRHRCGPRARRHK